MKIKDFDNKQGFCPRCKEEGSLDYGSAEFVDNMCYFRWTCSKCGLEGEEWYSLDFQGHNVFDEDGNSIEL